MCVMDAGSTSQAATCPVHNPVSLFPSITSQQYKQRKEYSTSQVNSDYNGFTSVLFICIN